MDLPIARIYQDARAARIYDGASEVHRMVDRARPAQARDAGRVGSAAAEACVSADASRADDIVRTRAEVGAGAREPLLVLEPLLAFLDAHGLGDGRAGVRADRRRPLQRHLRRDARRRASSSCGARRAGRCRPSAHDVLREARVLRALAGRAPVAATCSPCATTRP